MEELKLMHASESTVTRITMAVPAIYTVSPLTIARDTTPVVLMEIKCVEVDGQMRVTTA